MTEERYVIVYRDGTQSSLIGERLANLLIKHRNRYIDFGNKRIAYRIRIREKPTACAACDMQPTGLILTSYPPQTQYKCSKCGKVVAMSEYLNPAKAYADAGLRK